MLLVDQLHVCGTSKLFPTQTSLINLLDFSRTQVQQNIGRKHKRNQQNRARLQLVCAGGGQGKISRQSRTPVLGSYQLAVAAYAEAAGDAAHTCYMLQAMATISPPHRKDASAAGYTFRVMAGSILDLL